MGNFFEEETHWLLEKLGIIEAIPLASGYLEIHLKINGRKVSYEFDRGFQQGQNNWFEKNGNKKIAGISWPEFLAKQSVSCELLMKTVIQKGEEDFKIFNTSIIEKMFWINANRELIKRIERQLIAIMVQNLKIFQIKFLKKGEGNLEGGNFFIFETTLDNQLATIEVLLFPTGTIQIKTQDTEINCSTFGNRSLLPLFKKRKGWEDAYLTTADKDIVRLALIKKMEQEYGKTRQGKLKKTFLGSSLV